MFATEVLSLSILLVFGFFIGKPVYDYLRDVKGLRRYPAIHPIAAFTNLWYMYVSLIAGRLLTRGRWVTYVHKRYILVHKAHQNNPIVRIGPNSLSFGDARAVQDILGHGTPVTKEDFYKVVAGTHRHVADVQDK